MNNIPERSDSLTIETILEAKISLAIDIHNTIGKRLIKEWIRRSFIFPLQKELRILKGE